MSCAQRRAISPPLGFDVTQLLSASFCRFHFFSPSVKMSGPKQRKVDSECRVFNKEWTTKYFFIEVRSTAVCLICQETVAVFKEYISRHLPQSMLTTLVNILHKNGRLQLRDWRLIYRHSKTFFTDKLRFKSQLLRQVFCWHSN